MLQSVIELQEGAVSRLEKKIELQKETTFRAPTGSGKTYMMSDLMDRVLSADPNVVFLVSTLSKGGLAEQNYDRFLEYSSSGRFKRLKPYLINTRLGGEERMFIPLGYNVYVLPRDLYKEGGILMQGAMISFLERLRGSVFKDESQISAHYMKIYVIKDECHQATNNLDALSAGYFDKIINFSATPNLKRGQNPDVQITDDEAVAASLIKRLEIGDENDTVEDAIIKFEEIKKDYRNLLGVNPCLIIQISNKDKAEDELNNVILPVLDKAEHQDLKWMVIVDAEKGKKEKGSLARRTNDAIGRKIPVKQWKDYAKGRVSTIDVIIFKMVISEGWDIPRACMLYQVRDTQSVQLDEQVMGRVRRNPRLLDFESLSEEAKKLATTAWVWGILPQECRKTYEVRLVGKEKTAAELRIKTTRLSPLAEKKAFDVASFLQAEKPVAGHRSIFELHGKLHGNNDMAKLCYEYAETPEQWRNFMEHFDGIKNGYEQYVCDYSKSMEVVTDENGAEETRSLPLVSLYVDNDHYLRISDWVWKRKGGHEKFSFDSDAEREWAEILKDLARDAIASIPINISADDMFGTDGIEIENVFLWGKNYPYGSEIKFEYYLNGTHDSFPDFVLKDKKGRIHLFEVKSLNVKSGSGIDSAEYQAKVLALKECYKQCSKITSQIFYLPVLDEDVWKISRFMDGVEDTLTEGQFRKFIIG